MAVVNDPGADILGGDDTPDAPLDPNAPQIRVSTNTKKINLILRHNLCFAGLMFYIFDAFLHAIVVKLVIFKCIVQEIKCF